MKLSKCICLFCSLWVAIERGIMGPFKIVAIESSVSVELSSRKYSLVQWLRVLRISHRFTEHTDMHIRLKVSSFSQGLNIYCGAFGALSRTSPVCAP
jgi:hypothetical protein